MTFERRQPGRVNQIQFRPALPPGVPSLLLTMPSGCITLAGVQFNIEVAVRFILSWMDGKGTFVFKGCAEDSATAEISRSQLWQWIRYASVMATDDESANGVVVDSRYVDSRSFT